MKSEYLIQQILCGATALVIMYDRTIPINNCLAFQTDTIDFRSVWHTQTEFEIVYIDSGWGTIHYSDQKKHYTQGDIMVLGPDIPHQYVKKSKDFRSLSVLFHPNLITPNLFDNDLTKDIRDFLCKASEGLVFRDRHQKNEISTILKILTTSGLEQAINLVLLLDQFSKHGNIDCFNIKSGYFSNNKNKKIQDILYYIDQHAHRILFIGELADKFSMSRCHFSRFFNKQVGKGFNQYLLEIRIERVCHLLINSDKSITEIAHEVGFESISSFNRGFLQLKNETPSSFRHQTNL